MHIRAAAAAANAAIVDIIRIGANGLYEESDFEFIAIKPTHLQQSDNKLIMANGFQTIMIIDFWLFW